MTDAAPPVLSEQDIEGFVAARASLESDQPRDLRQGAYTVILRTMQLAYAAGAFFEGREPTSWIPRILESAERCDELAVHARASDLPRCANGFAVLAGSFTLDAYNVHVMTSTRDDAAERRYLLEALNYASNVDGPVSDVADIDWPRVAGRLFADVFWAVAGMPWGEQAKAHIEAQLPALAHAAETIVGATTDWARDDAGLGRWAVTRRKELARLSAVYGDPTIALARVDDARPRIAPPERRASLELSLDLVAQFAARRLGRNDVASQLRANRLSQIEQARAARRSAAARIREMENLSPTLGHAMVEKFIGDVFDAHAVFDIAEAARARTLLDYVAGQYRPLPAQAQEAALALEAKLIEGSLESSATKGGVPDWVRRDLPNVTVEEWRALRNELILATRRQADMLPQFLFGDRGQGLRDSATLDEIEALYARASAGFTASALPISLDELQGVLADDEVLIYFVLPDNGHAPGADLTTIVVTAGTVERRHAVRDGMATINHHEGDALISWGPFVEGIANLRLAISREDDPAAKSSLATHFEWLFGDCLDRLDPKIDRMIIVPTGGLHMLPFAALIDRAGQYLVDRFAITTVPSASVLHALRRRPSRTIKSALAVANPRPIDGYADLSEADAEVEAIVGELAESHLACSTLAGEKATEREVRAALRLHSIVHLATHGEFPLKQTHDRHAILVARDNDTDGRIEAHEIRQLDLHGSGLVVLSICDGALIAFGPGDELHGLVSAFLIAGATNVVGALWPSNDLMTRLLMTRFYRCLLTDGPARALQRAQRFLKREAGLRFWAGFELVGSDRIGSAESAVPA